MKSILLVAGTLLLVLGFQNCSKAKFSPAGAEELASKLDVCEGDDCLIESEGDVAVEAKSGEAQYICILKGSGSSVRTGLENEVLMENGSTPGTVCMSLNACENIVSLKLNVKGAARRGFCPDKNPHVLSLSDDEIKKAIEAL